MSDNPINIESNVDIQANNSPVVIDSSLSRMSDENVQPKRRSPSANALRKIQEMKEIEVDQASLTTPPKDEKQKLSLTFRAKNWMIRASSSTNLGQSVFVQSMGENGARVVESLFIVTERILGESQAKNIKSNLIQTICKAKLLFEEKILLRKDSFKCEITVLAVCKSVLQAMEGDNSIGTEKLISYFKELQNQITTLVRPVVSAESMALLESIFGFFETRSFVEAILWDEAFEVQREVIHDCLKRLIEPLLPKSPLKIEAVRQPTDIDEEPVSPDTDVESKTHGRSKTSYRAVHMPESDDDASHIHSGSM